MGQIYGTLGTFTQITLILLLFTLHLQLIKLLLSQMRRFLPKMTLPSPYNVSNTDETASPTEQDSTFLSDSPVE